MVQDVTPAASCILFIYLLGLVISLVCLVAHRKRDLFVYHIDDGLCDFFMAIVWPILVPFWLGFWFAKE